MCTLSGCPAANTTDCGGSVLDCYGFRCLGPAGSPVVDGAQVIPLIAESLNDTRHVKIPTSLAVTEVSRGSSPFARMIYSAPPSVSAWALSLPESNASRRALRTSRVSAAQSSGLAHATIRAKAALS
jgi:hypothetical protein